MLHEQINLLKRENEFLKARVEELEKEREDKMSIPNQWEAFWNYRGVKND